MSKALKMENHTNTKDFVSNITRPDITKEEMMESYKAWATNYDTDMAQYPRKTPQETLISVLKFENDKSIRVLDLAAGTGVMGQLMTEEGFTNIDALDGSSEMLEIAKNRNVYKHIYCQFIGDTRTPGVEDGAYDIVVCVGAFYPGHLDESCLPEVLRILKPEGGLYFSRMLYEDDPVDKVLNSLQSQNICKFVEKRLVKELNDHGDGYIYVVQKL